MKFSILTLFPNLVESYLSESIMKRAQEKNKIDIEIIDIRSFATSPHNQVDDYQYGGGKGMVLMIEPIVLALESVKKDHSLVALLSPQGKTWNQGMSKKICREYKHLILIAGHYEGFDERILNFVDIELSIGDFVITGGELAALVVVDSITRIIPGVITSESYLQETFENNLLDFPVYTKPIDFRGFKVPEVLTSGHHKNIENFRQEQALKNTLLKRPDLLNEQKLSDYQKKIYQKIKTEGDK
ncbi:tRNA (guanine-N(1)-)-methyltransferase [Spiroplasma sabaudiense Ar-1343]|uniref:tRNA (guanine-N(1)-)-methyltransferase n=1 Tax=Spiroplasma sabaudiense Ar-1343 TaxID=1276257 RepID=W6A9L7_9MOLU|nr:tRNA (guanosine(37)-N1)-methyltransferase TrmD [Spiroplasma sabaudiense]AHI53681.1 tRNA (guanine-N(1)-)-methyltransferase [Spiroplasma sabaudiense Ar-1343]